MTTFVQQILVSNPLEDSTYADWLQGCSGGTTFHTLPWLRSLTEAYGYRPLVFFVRVSEEIRSAILIAEVDSRLTGKRGVSLPFSDFARPTCASQDDFDVLLSKILEVGKERGWRYVEFRDSADFFPEVTPSTRFHSHRLPLQPLPEAQFHTFSSATRRAIRRAEKTGLRIEIGESFKAVSQFYELQSITRQRHGLPPQPKKFFQRMHANLIEPGLGKVFLAYRQDVPVAGAIFLTHEGKTLYKYGASDERYQSYRPNNFVMWSAIRWHIEGGFKELHFGRSSLAHEGLRRYKLAWGAIEGTVAYHRLDLGSGQIVSEPDRVEGWYNSLFKMMPLRLSQAIGNKLYRHIA